MFHELFHELDNMKKNEYPYEILFLEANEETLIKRYKESRRIHPLSPDGKITVGISKEREILKEVRDHADNIIDTSDMSARQLKENIVKLFSGEEKLGGLTIDVNSFGFKYGIPLDADLVFDVRFLPNPFYVQELREMTGLDGPVASYVFGYEQTRVFCDKLLDMVCYLLPTMWRREKASW